MRQRTREVVVVFFSFPFLLVCFAFAFLVLARRAVPLSTLAYRLYLQHAHLTLRLYWKKRARLAHAKHETREQEES